MVARLSHAGVDITIEHVLRGINAAVYWLETTSEMARIYLRDRS